MRVLHVIPSVALSYGGPAQAVYSTCRALQRAGIKVLIATTNGDGRDELPEPVNLEVSYREVPTIFFRRELIDLFGYSHLLSKYSHSLAKWLSKNVHNFDLVHIHDTFQHSTIAAANACVKSDIPYIIRPLGTLDPWSLQQKKSRKLVFWHLGVKRAVSKAAAIHYTTQEEQELAERALSLSKGFVVPNALEFDRLRSWEKITSIPNRDKLCNPYVLVLSRLHPKKGIDWLIRSFAMVTKHSKFQNWKLIIAGDGEPSYVAFLKDLSYQENITNKVVFTGWLKEEQKYAMLNEASLLALTSFQENFGICVIEALYFGVPVLISPFVNLAKEVQSAGVGWVTELELEQIATHLSNIMTNDKDREERGQRGRSFTSQFASEKVAFDLHSLYLSILATTQNNNEDQR